MGVNIGEESCCRRSLPVFVAGFLSGLLWIGTPIYIGSIGMQITHIMSLLLVLSFLLGKARLRDYQLFQVERHILLCTLCLFAAIGLILTAGILSSINASSLAEVLKFEIGYLVGLTLITVLISSLQRDEDITFVLSCLLFGGALVVAITLSGYLVPLIGEITLNRYGRAKAFALHPNQFGMMLAAIMPLAAANLAVDYRSIRRWLILVIISTGLVISGSKTNLFISAFLCPLTLFLVGLCKQKSLQRIPSLLGAILAMVLVGIFGVFLLQKLAPQTLISLQILWSDPEGYRSILSRREIWIAALTIVKKYPFLGIGAGNTPLLLDVRHCHNVFIEYYLTMGLLGLITLVFFILCLLFICWYVVRISRYMPFIHGTRVIGLVLGIVSYLLSNQSSDSFGPTTLPVFWVLVGVLLAQGNSWMMRLTREVERNP
jgi:O-antigen ligase